MGKNEFTKLFTFLEKYGINFNEYMLAKMLAWAQTKQNAEVVNEYFSMRVCCRGFTIQSLQGLKDAKLINESYEMPKAGSVFEPCGVPLDRDFMQDIVNNNLIHYGMLGLTFTEDVLKTDIEMEQKEGVVGVFYQETNDAGIIERLFRYDTSVINIDAEIFIFIEKRGNDSFDVTIKRTMDVEEEDTEEEWAKVPEKLKVLLLENRKEETKFIRTCVGID